jgi:hypothetical protein
VRARRPPRLGLRQTLPRPAGTIKSILVRTRRVRAPPPVPVRCWVPPLGSRDHQRDDVREHGVERGFRRRDRLQVTVRYGSWVPEATGQGSPAVSFVRLPRAVGETAVATEPLRHGLGNAATGGIWRVRGAVGSAILKVARLPAAADPARAFPTSDELHHWNYWRRETLAYETGLAATAYADAGIAAPALLEGYARADGTVELWLADVIGTAAWDWPVTRLGRFAYELGVAQARWAGRVPDLPWLSRHWLGQYLAEGPPRFARVDDADWDHPSIAVWPAEVRQRLRRLQADHGRLTAIAETAERTLCHLDVWPANLIDEGGTSVLLDWSFTGDGAVGEDVANLIIDSCTDGLMDAALLPEIADSATDGYLRGLHDGGWTGSAHAMRSIPPVSSASEAVEMVRAGLGYLAAADATQMAAEEQASCLQALEQITAMGTAARASILGAFTSGQGYSADADYSPRAWLIHQTRVTKGAAVGYTAWTRRAAGHPEVFAVLAAGEMSKSFARTICTWTDRLRQDCRAAADAILLGAAAAGMGVRELAGLAREIFDRSRPDAADEDAGGVLEDRSVTLQATFDGAGVLHGDLTPACAAVVGAVLDALPAPAGAGDTRTHAQRYHDGLQEAMR